MLLNALYDDPLQEAVLAFKQKNRQSIVRQAESQKLPTDTWKPYNTALEAAYIGGTLGDVLTTRSGIRMGATEGNPILKLLLGEKPTDLGLAAYGIGSSVLHPLIAQKMEEPYRTGFQTLTLLLRLLALRNNIRLGAKITL